MAVIEQVRAGLATDALRANYVADRATVYGDLVLALLRAGRPAEAFAVADGARSRGLLEHLSESRAGPRVPSACIKGIGVDDFDRIFCANAVVLPPYSSADVRQLRGFGETVGHANVETISPRGSWAVGSANEHLHGGYVGAHWNIF